MAHNHHLVGLDDLLLEEVHKLQVLLAGHPLHGIQEDLVVGLGQLEPREQVRDDAIEQRDVVRQELWQVDIDDGAQQLRIKTGKWLAGMLLFNKMCKSDILSTLTKH